MVSGAGDRIVSFYKLRIKKSQVLYMSTFRVRFRHDNGGFTFPNRDEPFVARYTCLPSVMIHGGHCFKTCPQRLFRLSSQRSTNNRTLVYYPYFLTGGCVMF